MKVLHGVPQSVEHDGLAPHVGGLAGTGEKEAPLSGVGARVQGLAVRIERSAVPRGVEVESTRGDPRVDVHDRGDLAPVLGVPSPGLEIDLVHDLRVEQLVQAPGDARGDRDAVQDRKSTRLNSSHSQISYAVFCLKKKKKRFT